MANNDAAFGLRTVGKLGSSPQNGGSTGYKLLTGTTGAIFSGDPVKMVSTGGIAVAAAGDTLLGIFRGVQYTDSSGDVIFKSHYVTATAADDMVALVEDDPNSLFEVQCDGSMATTAIGNNADMATYAAGSTKTGMSAVEISSTTGTSTAQFRIVGFSQDPSNSTTGSANINVVVKINEHFYAAAAGV
jgi:hypothetical protein|tara:strand:- start:1073 stop:1636 length:564 start_codon:yes stop_codon:yes gene_type:complete